MSLTYGSNNLKAKLVIIMKMLYKGGCTIKKAILGQTIWLSITGVSLRMLICHIGTLTQYIERAHLLNINKCSIFGCGCSLPCSNLRSWSTRNKHYSRASSLGPISSAAALLSEADSSVQ